MEYSEEEKKAIEDLNKLIFLLDDVYSTGLLESLERDEYQKSIHKVLDIIERQRKEIEELKENSVSKNSIKELADFAINATNSKDDYSIGMCNGMIYLIATLLNEEPVYKKCEHESIPKEAIREKIKRIKKLDCDIRYDKYDIIDILKELLGE